VKNDTDTFNVEAGPSFIAEKQSGETRNYFSLRLAERWEHKFSATARFWEQVEILPQVDNFNNYIINAEAGVEALLTKAFSIRLVAQDTFDNEPAEGLQKNDFKLIGQLGYKF
jgi:putative salt-induced outer membrane protein YdiY